MRSDAEIASDELIAYELEKLGLTAYDGTAARITADEIVAFELEKLIEEITKEVAEIDHELDQLEGLTGKKEVDAPDGSLCSLTPNEQRFDCLPEGNVTQSQCEARGCCWNAPSTKVSFFRLVWVCGISPL